MFLLKKNGGIIVNRNKNLQHDFEGWATKNDLRCADGRVIRRGAFSANNGKRVPMFWNHQHNSVSEILGHALLEDRDEGVWAYGYFNNSPAGQNAKEAVLHGDVEALSIWANNLDQNGPDVMYGVIRELSLVPAGANPGAFIESVVSHGYPADEDEDEALFYTGEPIIVHAEDSVKETEDASKEGSSEKTSKTVKQVYEDLNEEQKQAVAIIVGQAIVDAKEEKEDEKGGDNMAHNLFDGSAENNDYESAPFISHSDMNGIFENAKKCGSLREAVLDYFEGNEEMLHSLDLTGMTTATGTQKYGFNDPSMLFPEYKSVTGGPPEWISRDMGWVTALLSKVHRTPFSRIKSMYANITEDDARARGYIKGKEKKEEVFTTLKRTTDPQTVYKLQKMDRDDILDITDFDTVAWIRAEMRVMLNEEIARAALIGDGRASDSDDKIKPDHVRPIATDVPLYNIKVQVEEKADEDFAKTTINEIIRSRKKYKGSGNPDFWTTEDVVTEMLLLEDKIGNKLYKTEQELATALRVRSIITVEPMEGQKINGEDLLGIIVNMNDYNIGADRGGEINNFDDFDIKFNQHLYLIETRISGALIKPYSAITLTKKKTEPVTPPSGGVSQTKA